MADKLRVPSGAGDLDRILGGLYIGDNVVWYDDAGSLATAFCHCFIQAAQREETPVVYVSFDRSPRNLLEKLGPLVGGERFILMDCFTHGKGAGSATFLKFYREDAWRWPCRIEPIEQPADVDHFMERLYGIHGELAGTVNFVFESITGMEELWGGEEAISRFYSHSCPRLYELNTVAYWIMEKKAHSPRLRAQINQIAQVAIDLSIKRGTASLTVLKAENRDVPNLGKSFTYWTDGSTVNINDEGKGADRVGLGTRLRKLRTKRGLSQSELARLVGVTPSSISQVESNLIYPSIPALLKMAEVLDVDVSAFFVEPTPTRRRPVFSESQAAAVRLPHLPNEGVSVRLLTPLDYNPRGEPYLIEIEPKTTVPCHFFMRKGDEVGYVLSGAVVFQMETGCHTASAGDVIYLNSSIPTEWRNLSEEPVRLLWVNIR